MRRRRARCFKPKYRVGDYARVRFLDSRGRRGRARLARCHGYRWKRNNFKMHPGGRWVAVWKPVGLTEQRGRVSRKRKPRQVRRRR